MRGVYPWLYVDYKKNLWRFSVNENKELNYRIMYTEGKWTKENLIDSRVTGFGLFIDDSEGIHLVYYNKKGELRYCTMKEKKWVGKILYKVEDDNYSIESIKIKIIGTNMHIFYLLTSDDGSDHGVIMHCIWDGNNTYINKLQDIILKENLQEYYLININNKNEIYLFYLSDEGAEISLNYSIYKQNKWGQVNRLYGIQGEEIFFDININKSNIHVINKSKENSYYFLDHVIIDSTKRFKHFRIYQDKNNIEEPLIIDVSNKIYSLWIENNEIYYSVFLGQKWTSKKKYNRDNNIKIERYNAYISEIREESIEDKKIYATRGLDIYLYNPIDLIKRQNKEDIDLIENTNKYSFDKEYSDGIEAEFYRIKEENKDLEEKLYHLNILLQRNQQGINNYNQQLVKALEQKRKAEENSRIFLELQKKIQGENENLIEEIKLLKTEEEKYKPLINSYIDEIELLKEEVKKLNTELSKKEILINNYKELDNKFFLLKEEKENDEVKLKEYIDEIKLLKEEVNNINKQLLIKDQNIQEELESKELIESKNKIIIEENLSIKKELALLIEENNRINTELEIEKNKSVMEKLLRKRK